MGSYQDRPKQEKRKVASLDRLTQVPHPWISTGPALCMSETETDTENPQRVPQCYRASAGEQ